ncbi:PREDICTED: alpha-N-acetyl-neuraminyl-2,3-beta-galactosyl-1,3-N-acetyl-galactosaminide alpha-2,6-sialyltransferase-like [Branchiostoma belcheri]|uniref:Alpha-N-acetyl-neuraminyl-2,3-beta-galactosyl-1, 3-N-acetyl-galactosaminide alpha-2,6-sialyltransferase-like n=1 Tax=Branchiostoma belcheri TaxID=7741 RepID=A0A6P4YCU9_BRABE|nr:PREDICTED: alpha-N-acetyl-neuraminyl-2,3-beta-galactosyl-1,3-N-acetyl-galactosaminide alpha-2,6-sialyltransferase-like [Branchiostoma belcheri]
MNSVATEKYQITMTISKVAQAFGTLLLVAVMSQYMLTIYSFSDKPQYRFLPRHITKKTIRGQTYHVHEVDPMSPSLREKYQHRRVLSVSHSGAKLRPQKEMLDYHRGRWRPEARPHEPLVAPLGGTGRGLTCNTCALVSNSGQLLGGSRGSDIDAADCVFRLNAAPTAGFERDVGERTTARVVSHKSLTSLYLNSTSVLGGSSEPPEVFVHGPQYAFGNARTAKLLRNLGEKFGRVEFYRFTQTAEARADEEFERQTQKPRSKSGVELSTGWYALTLMMDTCQHIQVYGMIPHNYCRLYPDSQVPYQYWSPGGVGECAMYEYHEDPGSQGQRLITERRIFRAWADKHNITFNQPAWV